MAIATAPATAPASAAARGHPVRPARLRWSAAFPLARAFSGDLSPPVASFGPDGSAVLGFSLRDEDDPTHSLPYLTTVSRAGTAGAARPILGAASVLDVSFAGRAAELLLGRAASGDPCCASVAVARVGSRRAPRLVVDGLAGEAEARDLELPGERLLAVVASEYGVWAAQSRPAALAVPRAHRLGPASERVRAMEASALAGGRTIVVWSIATGGQDAPARGIRAAGGTLTRAPEGGRLILSVTRGHWIDELAVARGRGGATLAWSESWFDRRGNFRQALRLRDLVPRGRTTTFPAPGGGLISGLALRGDGRGGEALAYKSCGAGGRCSVMLAWRAPGGSFDPLRRIGTIDTTEAPAAALGAGGAGGVGWIDAGRVLVAGLGSSRRGPSAARVVGRGEELSSLTLVAGPDGRLLASWIQGTASERPMAAELR